MPGSLRRVMRAREKFIIRRVGNLTCHQLRENIRCDLKDLVAYTYATALDGSPSIRERLRIGIIRFVCPMHIEGQQHRRAAQFLYCSKRGLSSDSLHVLVAYEDKYNHLSDFGRTNPIGLFGSTAAAVFPLYFQRGTLPSRVRHGSDYVRCYVPR
jgi:hypothetical protein